MRCVCGGLPGHCALPLPPSIPPVVWGGGQVDRDAVLTHTLDCGAARTFRWHPALRAWARESDCFLSPWRSEGLGEM